MLLQASANESSLIAVCSSFFANLDKISEL